MDKILDRILHKLDDVDLLEKLHTLSASDLNSLLLELMKKRKIAPIEMLKAFSQNRFSVPSEFDPIEYHNFEAFLLKLVKGIGVEGIMISPVAPFGNCSAFGCVDQNNIVSAIRGTEVLADPTNMLATIIADKLKNKKLNNSTPKHFCTTARVTRTQPLMSKAQFAHFGIFCIVSSGKDAGSYACEKDLLLKQFEYYKLLLLNEYEARLSVTLRKRSGYTDSDGFFDKMTQLIQTELPDTNFEFDIEHENNLYYKGINFKVYMQKGDENIEIGDGGFVDWIQQMTGNKKERCLISGIGIDRMLMLRAK